MHVLVELCSASGVAIWGRKSIIMIKSFFIVSDTPLAGM